MSYEIKKAAVLGAGVMGATIAAHLGECGDWISIAGHCAVWIDRWRQEEGVHGAESPDGETSFAAKGLDGALKSKPASFYSKKNASLVTIGNLEDDLNRLADVDWIIEVVIENLKIKQDLFARVEKVVKPQCIVTTNTSGIPIKDISTKFGAKLKQNFLGTHFLTLLAIWNCSR